MQNWVPAVALFAAFAFGQDEPAKLADFYLIGNSVIAEGIWRADNLNEKTELAFDSVTRLECHRHGGRDMVDSESYCVQMTATDVHGMPSIAVDYYPVLTWDSDKIIAADSSTANFPICIWTQITVNLHDHSIMSTDTRKLGKGHEGFKDACKEIPLAQTYHLVDQYEELVRRQLRRARLDKEKK